MYCKYGFSHGWRPCTRRLRTHDSCRSLECISYAAKGGCVCNANATCQGTAQVCKKVPGSATGEQKCTSKPYSKEYCTDVTKRSQLSSLVTYVAPPPPPPPPPGHPAPPPRIGAKVSARKTSG